MPSTKFVCQSCGAIAPRWQGKCSECESWNTIVEEVVSKNILPKKNFSTPAPISLSDVLSADRSRMVTGFSEFDRVLGGGFVNGSSVLLGGNPGIGKSTIALQIISRIEKCLYISGEESLQQIKLRAERINIHTENIKILAESDLEKILQVISDNKFDLVVIDSIQSLCWDNLSSSPGTVAQVREVASRLISLAKNKSVSLLIIGHVTKEGSIAGPKILEHMVDTVLYFEGDKKQQFRIIRAFKNRFGSVNEVGIFYMRKEGLVPIDNPSGILLQERSEAVPGSVVFPTMEGTRPLCVEIQALVSNASGFGIPRRTVSGIDNNRLSIILAILEKKAGYVLSNQDVFLNVVGGIYVSEPAADLAIALAIISSFKNISISLETIVLGELGLAGEIRAVSHIEQRLQEIKRMGFKKAILPVSDYSFIEGLEKTMVSKIWEELLLNSL